YARNDLERFDGAGFELDRFLPFHFQIQRVAVFSAENMEVKMVSDFEVLAPGKINGGDRVERIGRLIQLVALDLHSLVSMHRPFLGCPVKACDGIDHLAVFSLTEREQRWRKSVGIYF